MTTTTTTNTIGKEQTIGCEIEFNNITRAKAAEALANHFGTQAIYYGGGYYEWHIKDQTGRTWKIERDSSIQGQDDQKCEMVSPILHYDDLETLQEVARQIRHAGGKSSPERGCGVHIHIGKGDHTAQSIRNLANMMAAHETLLTASLNIAEDRLGWYCRPVDPKFIERINKAKPKTLAEMQNLWYDGCDMSHRHYDPSRYHILNLHATWSKGTIEFRAFNFTKERGIHAGELKAWVHLCLAMSNQAKRIKTASPRETQQDNQKYAMRCWLLRLGFIGEEYATSREHLCKHLTGDAAFRHGRTAA